MEDQADDLVFEHCERGRPRSVKNGLKAEGIEFINILLRFFTYFVAPVEAEGCPY